MVYVNFAMVLRYHTHANMCPAYQCILLELQSVQKYITYMQTSLE